MARAFYTYMQQCCRKSDGTCQQHFLLYDIQAENDFLELPSLIQ